MRGKIHCWFLTVFLAIFMVGCGSSSRNVMVNARFLECVECTSEDEELNRLWAFSLGGSETQYSNFPKGEGQLVCNLALRDADGRPSYEASALWLVEQGKRMSFHHTCPGQRIELVVLDNSVRWMEYFEGLPWNVVVKRRIWDAKSGDPRMCVILERISPSDCPEKSPVMLGL